MNKEKLKIILSYFIKSTVFALLIYLIAIENFLPFFYIIYYIPIMLMSVSEILSFAALILDYIIVFAGSAFLLSKIPPRSSKENGFFKKHILSPLIIAVGGGILSLGMIFLPDAAEKLRLTAFEAQADEFIEYNTSTYHMDGIMGTDYVHNMIMIDYDTKRVGFLIGSYDDRFIVISLKDTAPINSTKVQTEYALSAPGAVLRSFYSDDNTAHGTTALELTMSDKTVYSANNLHDENDSPLFLVLG